VSLDELVTRFRAGDVRALAQAISRAEQQDDSVPELFDELCDDPPRAFTVGFTGAPGVGKSTLVNAVVGALRGRDQTVGVVAIDPSSPFSGGALLGDRVRMHRHALDPGVYVRSMSARGHVGGLALAAGDAVWLLGAFGFDEILVETVGAGQSEFEVPSIVDTTIVVLTPGLGDAVQLQKAGIMEIADVFAVNKADLPGTSQVVRELRTMLNMGPKHGWRPPIIPTVSNRPDPSAEQLWEAIERHREHLVGTEAGRARTEWRLREATASLVGARVRARTREVLAEDEELRAALLRDRLPNLTARRVLASQWPVGHTGSLSSLPSRARIGNSGS